MGKKSKDEFKAAFKAVKKPKPPGRDGKKQKSALEKAVDDAEDWDDPEFKRLAQELYDEQPDYMVDLIAYKFVKHFDEGSEQKPFWTEKVPKEALTKALAKVVPGDMSDKLTQATLEKSLFGKGTQENTANIIYERDPEGATEFALTKWSQAYGEGNEDAQLKWAKVMPTTRDGILLAFDQITSTGNADAARTFALRLTNLKKDDGEKTIDPTSVDTGLEQKELDHEAIRGVAAANPKLFVTQILPGLKAQNDFVEIATNPELQTLLKKKAPKEWEELVAATPVLSLLKNVEVAITKKKLKDPAKIVGAMFDAIVNNNGIPLAYATNTIDNNRVILNGGTDKDQKSREKTKEVMGDACPDLPATQCHMLLHLTEQMMDLCPGLTKKPKITQGTINNILLTKPLASIPGKGLLDKTFGGNVFDEKGKSTDQILFTGDSGKNSHTWVVIDGVEYDPVLGTRGNEVAESIGEQFDWLKEDRVAKSSGGNYIIKGLEDTPKPKANKMGFSSGYLMTKQPEKHLSDEELNELGLEAAKETVGVDN